MNRGLGDVTASATANTAIADALGRAKDLETMVAPSHSGEAVNVYKDLTNSAEQLSRGSESLMLRYPRIMGFVVPGAGHDLPRQEIVRGLLSRLHPAGLNSAGISAPSDVIGKMRASGFRDYDQGHWMKNNFETLRSGAGDLAKLDMGPAHTLIAAVKHMGQAKMGLGAAAVGGGIAALSGAFDKKANYDVRELAGLGDAPPSPPTGAEVASSVASPLSAMLAAHGARDLLAPSKDILVSWGEDDRLGQGHASPGKNILKLINEDPRFKALGARGVAAPTTQGTEKIYCLK